MLSSEHLNGTVESLWTVLELERVGQHDGKALMTGVGKLHLLYSHTVEFLFAFSHWPLLLLLSLNHGLVFYF